LEIVPAGKARDAGLDKSMILGYGQDDRICAFTSANAIFDISGKMVKTIMVSGDKLNINVADLNSGVYLINLYNEKGVQTGKFVKK
jgi:aspartyl aminopeptidase